MIRLILFTITLISLTNVSYASFPVVEKVSNPLYDLPSLIIWTIVVFTLLVLLNVLFANKKRTGGWRRKPWPLYLFATGLGVVAGILMIIWMWRGLGCMIGFC